ncbi:hypothetical protein VIAG107301_00335 [Vibrio agarivorans]
MKSKETIIYLSDIYEKNISFNAEVDPNGWTHKLTS